MLPLEFLLITVRPVVVMQLRNRGAGGLDLRIVRIQPSPLTLPILSISALLQVYNWVKCAALVLFGLRMQTEWELRGLDSGYTPASFDLGVRGSLYADRGQRRGSRLRGHLEISITVALPPPLRIVPEAVLRGVAESVSIERELAELLTSPCVVPNKISVLAERICNLKLGACRSCRRLPRG